MDPCNVVIIQETGDENDQISQYILYIYNLLQYYIDLLYIIIYTIYIHIILIYHIFI